MTAPREVVIDSLVLRGVPDAHAPAVIDAFSAHLSDLLGGEVQVGDDVTGTEDERLGRRLAVAVYRVVRR